MKYKLQRIAYYCCALTLMLFASASSMAQTTFTAADPTVIQNSYRVDSADGVLQTFFTAHGEITTYLWLAGLIFVVGWAGFRRLRRVMG